MNTIKAVTLFVLAATLLAFSAEDAAEERIKKSLSRKVSFEFVDTPLSDALEFIRHLANVPIILDPKAIAAGKDKAPISLRVADMEMDKALQWILKLADLEFNVQDHAVFVFHREKEDLGGVEKKIRNGELPDGSLRARFATGDMVEADSVMLKARPQLAQEIMSLAYDPVKDEILVLVPGHDIPPNVQISTFIKSAKKVAPDAQFDFDDQLKLLMVRSNDDSDLRRINAIARALRRAAPTQRPGREGPRITLRLINVSVGQVVEAVGKITGATLISMNEGMHEKMAQTVSVDFTDADVREVLEYLRVKSGLNFLLQGKELQISLPRQAVLPPGAVRPPKEPDPPKEKARPIEEQQF